MTTTTRLTDGVPILEPNGKIIGTAASELQEKLVSQIDASNTSTINTSTILINFNGVNKIDSSGLGTLVSAYIAAKRKKGRIGIINVGRNIKSLVVQNRLINIFEHFENEDAAVAALSTRA